MKKTNTNPPAFPALVYAILLFATSANSATIFVDVNVVGGTNDGSTWANAFSSLQNALAVATSGDEIWVAAGTYDPTPGTNRTVSFVMKDGVGIYGGFSGTETSLGQRDWVANVCTLSGDLGVQGDSTDNSYHVIFNDQNGLTNTAVLDGFTVTGGNADAPFYPENSGGGMFNSSSSPTVTNCTFSGNSGCSGGSMFNENSSSPVVTNCTFSGNSGCFGGGMGNSSSSPAVTNCTFSGNSASNNGGGMFNSSSSPTVTNCSFSGNSAIFGGGMFNDDSSPVVTNCILWSNSTEIENTGNGSPTVTYSIVLGGHAGTGNLSDDPLFVNAGSGDLHLLPCSPAIDAGTATGAPVTDFDGDARPFGLGFDMGFDETTSQPSNISYVKPSAPGNNDGTSWTDAFTNLQDALAHASVCDVITEIWVAAGTYHPTPGTDRTVSFVMKDDLGIYGGFSGTETSLGQRDWVANVTILSGDIGVQGDSTDNSYHVIYNDNSQTSTAVLDGFTVTAGNADESIFPEDSGGGMYNDNSSPTVTNCTFSGNSADFRGGGMYNVSSSSPTVTNCTFSGNSTSFSGGGMYNVSSSSPTVTNCTFSGNSTSFSGGGMTNGSSSSPAVTNCTFSGNSASSFGGGMYNDNSSPTVTNCTFSGNNANNGGGMYNSSSSLAVTNCSFSGNNANSGGGGMRNVLSSPAVTNCTFSGNSASFGGGMVNSSSSSPTVTNCILWGNGTEIDNNSSSPMVTYSIVQGGYAGTGNLNADPLFVNAAGGDLHLLLGSPAINAGTATGAPATDFDGDARPQGIGFDMGFDEVPCPSSNIIYVKTGAPGNNDGTSWTDAFTNLQDALALASVCNAISEIWVAAGTYHPTPGTDRMVSFVMIDGVGIYGGFSGTETSLEQRDWVANVTILSGDLGVQGDNTDNSYHVIYNDNGQTSTAVLDGFTVTAGNAVGAGFFGSYGGGMVNSGTSPTVTNCSFSGNSASADGGGMYNFFSSTSPVVTNCSFSENSASGNGGGMHNDLSSSPVVTNCSFSENSASGNGGGVFNNNSSPVLTNCILWGNGTEIEISGGSTTVTFSIVQGGYAGTGNLNADPLFVNAAGGDLHLLPGSPAIDAGTGTGAPSIDFDGDARPSGAGFDMGFDEWQEDCIPPITISWTGGTNMWNLPGTWDLGYVPFPCNDVEILTGDVTVPAGFTANSRTLEVGLGAVLEVELGAELMVE